MKKNLLVVLVSVGIILILSIGFGIWYFVIRDKHKGTSNGGEQTVFQPLKLEYTANNFGGTDAGKSAKYTLWIDRKDTCNDRTAYLGIFQVSYDGDSASSTESEMSVSNSRIAKLTLYEDNGEFVTSEFTSTENLAFDDLRAQRSDDAVLPLLLNNFFSLADKNFNDSPVWDSNTPVVLNDVYDGSTKSDYSIVKDTVKTDGILPCQNFIFIAKGENGNWSTNVCVVEDKKIGDVNAPFIISFSFQSDDQNAKQSMPNWELTSYTNEKTSTIWIPQCLAPVRCQYITPLSSAEEAACTATGGTFQDDRDDSNCVISHTCYTKEELAAKEISDMQAPGCPVDPGAVNKLIQCKNSHKNWNGESNSQGCITNVQCI